MKIASTLAVLLAATTAPLLNSPGPRSHWEPLVQPATYVSPGGAYRLHARSLARNWRAGGHCRLEHDGRVVWESDLPLALWDAEVLEDGRVVGLAYNEPNEDSGDLVVAAIGADGEVAWQFTEPNQAHVVGMGLRATYRTPVWFVHVDTARVVFELDPLAQPAPSEPRFRALDLSSGEAVGVWTLPRPGAAEGGRWRLVDLEKDPATGHLVTCWWGSSYSYGVALYDARVWPVRELSWWQAQPPEESREERRGGAKFSFPRLWPRARQAESFVLASDRDPRQRRVLVEHEQEHDTWRARVLDLEAPEDTQEPPAVELEELPPVELKIAAPEAPSGLTSQPLTSVEAFGFDVRGNVEVVSSVGTDVVHRTLDHAGDVLHSAVLPRLGFEVDYRCKWGDGPDGTWLVADRKNVHRIDVARGTSELVLRHEDFVSTVVVFPDGGFVLRGYTSGLQCFDAQGEPIGAPSGKRGEEYVCDLLGRSSSGDAIALEGSNEGAMRLRILADGGRQQRLVELTLDEELLDGHLWNGLLQTREGSFWLAETTTGFGVLHTLLVEIDDSGEVLTRIEPHLADGACFPLDFQSLDVAPDGSFWSANRDVVASVSKTGEPGPVLGRHFDPPQWDWARSWRVDRSGRLLVHADDRGAYVFDLEGDRTGHLQLPSTCDEPLRFSILVERDGIVWWQIGFRGPFARFSERSEFLGIRHLGPYDDAVRFFGEGTDRWACDSRELVHVVSDSRVVQKLATRPDGAWWRDVEDWVVSPDGARLVVADVLRAGGRQEGAFLACYDFEAGTEWFVDTPLGGGQLSLAGDWVLWGTRLIHWPTRTVRSVTITGAQVVDTPRGPEIWLHDREQADEDAPERFRRFALPDPG